MCHFTLNEGGPDKRLFMKLDILELLKLPREIVLGEMELDDCPHDGFYDTHDKRCRDCPQGMECIWLCRNDTISALKLRRLDELTDALDFALCYMHSTIAKWGHDMRYCRCDVCTWYGQAHKVHSRVQM